jgi:hypothetical protein
MIADSHEMNASGTTCHFVGELWTPDRVALVIERP